MGGSRGGLLHARLCSKHHLCIHIFHPFKNRIRSIQLTPAFYTEEADAKRSSSLSASTQLIGGTAGVLTQRGDVTLGIFGTIWRYFWFI